MNKSMIFLFLVPALFACNRETAIPNEAEGGEIIFYAEGEGLDASVSTKASVVSSLSSFNVSATTGTSGSETSKWNNVAFSGSGSYSGGKFWPSTDPGYHFYASNASLSFNASGTTVNPSDNSTDVIVAYMGSPAYKSGNTLIFDHIYARLGTITLNAPSGYTASNISCSLSAPTSGSYNLRTGAWTAGAASTHNPVNGSNDIYLVPGSYTLSVTYTISRDEYSETLTKSASITLAKGMVNTVSATLVQNSSSLVFSVQIKAWGTNELTPTLG